jgi:hypothetical protein
MNIKGFFAIFSVTACSLLVSVGIVHTITYLERNLLFYESETQSYLTAEPAALLPAAIEDESALSAAQPLLPEPAADYSYPQDYITVDNSYFEDAVFLGDSRMQAFIKYCGISGLRTYAYMGLTVEKYFTDQTFRIGDVKMSASEALELDRNFGKAYLMFGTNELGWAYPDVFIKKYTEVVQHIRQANPDAVIFVLSVLPVSETAYKKQSFLKNETVYSYNELLLQMCAEQEVYYLDLASVVANEKGALPNDAATDGIHPNKEYVEKCFDYMRTHAIRPVPAENISEENNNEIQ